MILVLNAGSSTLKYNLFQVDSEATLAQGVIESIGEPGSQAVDHRAAFEIALLDLSKRLRFNAQELTCVGHRIVHGGTEFGASEVVTQANFVSVLKRLQTTLPLAPLHNPAAIRCLQGVFSLVPHVPQVMVFDTGFFHDLPLVAQRYALPEFCFSQHSIRRYGAHGTSHHYVMQRASEYLNGSGYSANRLITLHLGNGASMAAIRHGKAIDTTMGLTPLEGLVMGTRCGDIDPAIVTYLQRNAGLDVNQVDRLLNRESGLRGVCGENDMRKVEQLRADGNASAILAFDLFCTRIRKYIGAYLAELGGLDALVFTAGIGQHSSAVRAAVCDPLSHLGIAIEADTNDRHALDISGIQSKTRVLVVPTNEELAILQVALMEIGIR